MDRRWIIVLGGAALAFVVWTSVFFTVPVWMQAVVVQLGDPVRTITDPGLYVKAVSYTHLTLPTILRV